MRGVEKGCYMSGGEELSVMLCSWGVLMADFKACVLIECAKKCNDRVCLVVCC